MQQQQQIPQQYVQPQLSASTGSALPLAYKVAVEDPVSIIPEVSDIMRSNGDCAQPRLDSVKLIEQIVYQQLRGLFFAASEAAMLRKMNPSPTQADFEFLMRNNAVKIARMRKHIKDMRILKKVLSIRHGLKDEKIENADSDEELPVEMMELYDEERTRRLFRADRISQILIGQEYLDFSEARKTSFYCRNGESIKNKLGRFLDLPTDVNIPVATMNILAYLAHETIAVIVDYAFLTRLNSDNRVVEPYSRVTSTGASPAMLHVCPEVTQGRAKESAVPITPKEIHEALRRFYQMSNKKIGYYRSPYTPDNQRKFLAI
ncbi:transcription initiation protein SPT3 homolog [Teleopsis dalmanni]|uniref:transcription initiation protein SPT3 homolog n=1 Tax=Teleopsis dalmanni TaxID=139649 RepID=UPI0018CDD2A3|nr:transcription initiation protein SPT3 homolog [Teleopsis dalmanni]